MPAAAEAAAPTRALAAPPPPAHRPWLARYAAGTLVATGFLLFAGGFTTSIEAGMVFLDWPLSNGSINPEGWLADPAMRAEHSHRLLGAKVGLLTLVLAIWLQRTDPRAWLRRAGWFAVALVVFQGVLGGLRVLLDALHVPAIETSVGRLFAMAHACTAQFFVGVLVVIAAACTRGWISGESAPRRHPAAAPEDAAVRRWAAWGVALLFAQLAIAAVMRHSHAGLSIPWFPTSQAGALVPTEWDFRVAVHFAHRAMAVVLTVALVGLALKVAAAPGSSRTMRRVGAWIVGLLALQIFLGAATVSSLRHPHITTWHVMIGAATLATTVLLWALARRHHFERVLVAAETVGGAAPQDRTGRETEREVAHA
jgi:cytochrome c oxidase assembly protein subunit 15